MPAGMAGTGLAGDAVGTSVVLVTAAGVAVAVLVHRVRGVRTFGQQKLGPNV